MTRLAQFVSVFLHPLIMPMYAMLVMLWSTPFGLVVTDKAKLFLLGVSLLFTFVFPLFFVVFLRKIGFVTSFAIRDRKERIAPLILGGFMCYMCYVMLSQMVRLHPLFSQMFFALTVFLLLLAIITKFWKVSLHMAAVGSLLAIVFIFSQHSGLILLILLLSGILGTSRLWLKVHTGLQVYVGFCLGFFYFSVYFIS